MFRKSRQAVVEATARTWSGAGGVTRLRRHGSSRGRLASSPSVSVSPAGAMPAAWSQARRVLPLQQSDTGVAPGLGQAAPIRVLPGRQSLADPSRVR